MGKFYFTFIYFSYTLRDYSASSNLIPTSASSVTARNELREHFPPIHLRLQDHVQNPRYRLRQVGVIFQHSVLRSENKGQSPATIAYCQTPDPWCDFREHTGKFSQQMSLKKIAPSARSPYAFRANPRQF